MQILEKVLVRVTRFLKSFRFSASFQKIELLLLKRIFENRVITIILRKFHVTYATFVLDFYSKHSISNKNLSETVFTKTSDQNSTTHIQFFFFFFLYK